MGDTEVDRRFRAGEYAQAADYLQSRMKPDGPGAPGSNDELLYLLDAALALHQADQFDASNAYFALAEKHAGLNDYTSISEETGTLLTSENTKTYRGEDFEKALIPVYKALNYALLGGYEDALVEARLVNRRLEQMRVAGEKPYKQSAFARYLSAILYEAEGELNDAYVDYRKVHEIEPEFRAVGRDLWRMARALGMNDHAERWASEFQLSGDDVDRSRNRVLGRRSGMGEIIVVYQNGISPVKMPDPRFHSIPTFFPRNNPVRDAEVWLDGAGVGVTTMLQDIEATAIENLREKAAGMVAKRVAGRVVKYAAADQVRRRTNSPVLGALTEILLVVSDQADTRSWNLLPKDLQILRIPVEPGRHEVVVRPNGGSPLPAKVADVPAGGKVFLSFRYLP